MCNGLNRKPRTHTVSSIIFEKLHPSLKRCGSNYKALDGVLDLANLVVELRSLGSLVSSVSKCKSFPNYMDANQTLTSLLVTEQAITFLFTPHARPRAIFDGT